MKDLSSPQKNYTSELRKFKEAKNINENKYNTHIIIIDKKENIYKLNKSQYESLLTASIYFPKNIDKRLLFC